jgi:hypothetical protein
VWYYLRGQLIFCYLYGFSGVPINRILCLLFSVEKLHKLHNTWKIQKKRISTQRYNNLSFVNRSMKFFISGSCTLLLETEYLNDFYDNSILKQLLKIKKIYLIFQ